jgi:hypothetical protein
MGSETAQRAHGHITAAAAIAALAIPNSALVGRSVPKKLLLEQGASARGDKRLVRDGLEGLDWAAALKPGSIGVPTYRDPERKYLEIAVLAAHVRAGAKAARLVEVIHRAVPYPVLLFTEQSGGLEVSLAHKRDAQNEAGKVVIDGEIVRAQLAPPAKPEGAVEQEFLAGIAIAAQPRANLLVLYQGWIERVEALAAARVTGRLDEARSSEGAAARRAALAEHARISHEIAELRAGAKREVELARRAELNLTLQRLQALLARTEAQL